MFKIFEKFIGKLQKFDNYWILRQEESLLILGTKIIIKEHREMLGNIFQPHSKNIDKELPVFFIVVVADIPFEHNEFKNRKLPILYLDKYQLAKNSTIIKDILEQFIVDNFKS